MANALDSGASQIRFLTSPAGDAAAPQLAVLDNGRGMTRAQLHAYHDIAATTKVRGAGIGFAGIGAKLALLLCRKVVSETWHGAFQAATEWRLESARRAPWDEVPGPGLLSAPGTAVVLILRSKRTPLADREFLRRTLVRQFHPILDERFDEILRAFYPLGVRFQIDDAPVALPAQDDVRRYFSVQIGRRRKPVGFGFVARTQGEVEEDRRGVAVSTYGKVIKRGWDWLGIAPRDRARITGLVEIPDLVSVLTTNKADFLQDGTSLAKYYKYRKAVQSEVDRLLAELGELEPPPAAPEKKIRPLERQLEQVIQEMLPDFPELAPLVGRRRARPGASLVADPAGSVAAVRETDEPASDAGGAASAGAAAHELSAEIASRVMAVEPRPDGSETGREGAARRKEARLTIAFTDAPGRRELGWLVESTLWVNRFHPAYRRAARRGWEAYHVIVTVAAVLAAHVEPGRPPQEFMSRFLSLWGAES